MSPVLDQILEKYVDKYGEKAGVELLSLLADSASGGQGYELRAVSMIDFDGYDVSHRGKLIRIDSTNLTFRRSIDGMADDLEECMNVEFRKSHASLLARIGWGTGKVVIGAVETTVGVIGIIVPEPGTTGAGVVMTTLGVNTVADGLSQLSGGNNGKGYNILGEGAASLGGTIAELTGNDPEIGRSAGEGAFVVVSIALGSWGSARILHVPGAGFLRNSSAQPLKAGRVDLLYKSERAKDGMTIININNNAGQSILRFVTHKGVLQANGRIGVLVQDGVIINGHKVLHHTDVGKDMIKGLLKLSAHGFMKGL